MFYLYSVLSLVYLTNAYRRRVVCICKQTKQYTTVCTYVCVHKLYVCMCIQTTGTSINIHQRAGDLFSRQRCVIRTTDYCLRKLLVVGTLRP